MLGKYPAVKVEGMTETPPAPVQAPAAEVPPFQALVVATMLLAAAGVLVFDLATGGKGVRFLWAFLTGPAQGGG